MKRPSFQFYPEAWMSDIGLRACSSAARGLWADMLCLMHQGTPYGHLRLERHGGDYFVPDASLLARMTGNKPVQIRRWLSELEAKGVLKRDENGVILSKKMVRDESQRESWRRRQERARDRRKSININSDDRDVTRDNPRDVTPNPRDVTPSVTPASPRSPSPTPSPTLKNTAPAEEGNDFSTFPQAEAVWWNEECAELKCESAFEEQLVETYNDAPEGWLMERWTYHSRWLNEHRERLGQLAARGLSEWTKNRIREDYAREASKPRTADELVAAESRRRRKDRI